MRPTSYALLRRWHSMLNLSQQSPKSWYRARIREELRELRTADTARQKLSETSDVFFSLSRAQHDGNLVRKLPTFGPRHIPVYAYMLAKYTSRWAFYRTLAVLCETPRSDLVCEVVNPSKDDKLSEVAARHQLDPRQFERISRRLRRLWPLLP